MARKILAILVTVGAIAIAGCATKLGPMTPGTLRAITGAEIPAHDREGMLGRRDGQAWMLVTFSSNDDYLEIAQRKDMHVVVKEALCTGGHVVRDIMASSILRGPPPASLVGSDRVGGQSPKRFLYRTYFAMTAAKRVAAGADPGPAMGYDLHSDPHDLCIQIQGGNMIGMSIKSGVAIFPRAAVEAAIKATRDSP